MGPLRQIPHYARMFASLHHPSPSLHTRLKCLEPKTSGAYASIRLGPLLDIAHEDPGGETLMAGERTRHGPLRRPCLQKTSCRPAARARAPSPRAEPVLEAMGPSVRQLQLVLPTMACFGLRPSALSASAASLPHSFHTLLRTARKTPRTAATAYRRSRNLRGWRTRFSPPHSSSPCPRTAQKTPRRAATAYRRSRDPQR
ncbi:hypothetical protein C8R45DRAFT_525634 [Mycena sanguinolenta]|nr:hypothetical protein C8R45DRAFT_525634 [Mycena sanguinolenta]